MKIGNLPQATSINDDDFFVVVQNGKTKRISKEILKIADDIVIEDNRIYLVINGQKIGVGIDLPQMTADKEMSDTSTNPVQNKVAKAYVDGVDIRLTENISSKFDVSANLYNEATNIAGKVINATTGELADNSTYTATDYIYLKAGQYIMTYDNTSAYFANMGTYDLSKNFIKRTDLLNGSINITEDCYVRFSGATTRVAGKEIMLVKGTELPTEYVPYYIKLKPEYLPDIDIESGLSTVTIADTDFIETSANLINQMTIEKGKVISIAGVKNDNTGYHITGKTYLKPATVYTALASYRISYYDKDNNHIKSVDIPSRTEPITFTTLDDFAYVILSLYYSPNIDYKWQLNEGAELLPYEPQHLIINGYRLYDEPDVVADPIKEFAEWNENFVDNSMPFLLEEDFDTPTGKQDGEETASNILSYYDELVNLNPEYITKTETTVTATGGTQKLVRYDFVEPNKDGTEDLFPQNKVKIILSSGTHREYSGIYGLYNAMKQITNNPSLIDLRRNVHFIVIPVLSPYAVDTHGRTNANGIDIARNFEVGWVASNPTNSDGTENPTYGGTAPLTEPESVYLDSVLKENSDALFYASCHSFQGSQTDRANHIIWCASSTNYVNNIGGKVVDKISRLLREKYAGVDFEYGNGLVDSPLTLLGSSDMDSPGGSEGRQALKYQIQGCTFEVCDWCRFEDNRQTEGKLTDFAILRACEVYINLLLVVCKVSNNQKTDIGDIETALDSIIAIQESFIGGATV